MSLVETEKYKSTAQVAIKDAVLQKALADFQKRLGPATAARYRNQPEGDQLRRVAHNMRMRTVENLDVLLVALAEKIRANGGEVYFARDKADALAYCLKIAGKHNIKRVVKGKSMVTEEIGLNAALAANGMEVVETDLGEYIVQLAGEHPSHIIAPAIHKTRQQIGRLFAEKLGIAYTDDPPALTRAARKALRAKFISADMGVTGCNLACAESGHITTVSNEGNIRMTTTLPKVHMAFMGMERIVANLADHEVLFRLLANGAAAQEMAGYVSYIGGPRRDHQVDGPKEFHLVILDNGRSRILADPEFREMLCCIRCAACLNVCPVYGKIGGHAYGYAYSGPVGAVVTPLLIGINRAKDLCLGESLCGACRDACPVDIDIPRMLLAMRAKLADGDPNWQVTPVSRTEKALYRGWSWIIRHRRLYDVMLSMGAIGQKALPHRNGMLSRLPYPFNGWTLGRNLKPLAPKRFMQLWAEREASANE